MPDKTERPRLAPVLCPEQGEGIPRPYGLMTPVRKETTGSGAVNNPLPVSSYTPLFSLPVFTLGKKIAILDKVFSFCYPRFHKKDKKERTT